MSASTEILPAETKLISWRQGRSLSYGEGVSFWARAEIVKAQAGILDSGTAEEDSGARAGWAMGSVPGGLLQLTTGDPVAAERVLREGHEVFRAMGEHGWNATLMCLLAEALSAQRRFDEALRVIEEAQASAPPDDIDSQARWRASRAKLFARRGQFAARWMAGKAEALMAATSWAVFHAAMLMAKAEVNRLAGALGDAAESLRAALRTYEDCHAVSLAEQARAALDELLMPGPAVRHRSQP